MLGVALRAGADRRWALVPHPRRPTTVRRRTASSRTGREQRSHRVEPSADRSDQTTGPLKVSAPYENQRLHRRAHRGARIVRRPQGCDDRTIESAAEEGRRTRSTCGPTSRARPSTSRSNGNPIYAAYLGPFDSMADACQARIATGSRRRTCGCCRWTESCARSAPARDEASALPRLSTRPQGSRPTTSSCASTTCSTLLYLAGVNPSNIVTGTSARTPSRWCAASSASNGLPVDGWVGPQTWGRAARRRTAPERHEAYVATNGYRDSWVTNLRAKGGPACRQESRPDASPPTSRPGWTDCRGRAGTG